MSARWVPENGKNQVSCHILINIANNLHVSLEYLVGSFLQASVPALDDSGIVFSMFMFGGLAMVVAAKLDKPKTEEL